jgi:putative transcriptional regulator
MDARLFAQLLESTQQVLEHAQGKRELRTTILPAPPKPMRAAEVRRLRAKLNASQAVFAHCLNVSTKLVQAWEAERRTPEGPALLLLRIVERNPGVVLGRAEVAVRRNAPATASPRHRLKRTLSS